MISTHLGARTPATANAAEPGVGRGLAMMLISGASNQTGAGLGAHAFSAIGPSGVIAVRQLMAAAVLLTALRPRVRRFTWPQWWPMLLLAAVFATMNLSLYTAIDRIGLALAVTLEGTAAASGVSALLYVPVVLTLAFAGRLVGGPLLYAMAAGVLSSVVPFVLDLTALRSVPARFFEVFMSVNPVLAALAGVIIFPRDPAMHEAVGITIVVVINVVAVGTLRPPRRRSTSRAASPSPV